MDTQERTELVTAEIGILPETFSAFPEATQASIAETAQQLKAQRQERDARNNPPPAAAPKKRAMSPEDEALVSRAFPDLDMTRFREYSGERRERLLSLARARIDRVPPPPPPILGEPAVADLPDDPRYALPPTLGHRVAGSGGLSTTANDRDFHTEAPRAILAPGDIITLRHVGGNRETWNRLVSEGRISLDPDLPDPGADPE